MRKVALFGDIHGCVDELKELSEHLMEIYPKIELYHLGDLEHRGPDSIGVIDYVMKHFKGGIQGNHDQVTVNQYERHLKTGYLSSSEDHAKVIKEMRKEHYSYLKNLPLIHVFDEFKTVICHAGLYPGIPLYKQSAIPNVLRAQLIKPNDPTAKSRWWGSDSIHQKGVEKTEKESKKDGYVRWYNCYDHEYNCVYGHSVMGLKPYINQLPGAGKTIGIDTGASFGGYLSALILPDNVHSYPPASLHENLEIPF